MPSCGWLNVYSEPLSNASFERRATNNRIDGVAPRAATEVNIRKVERLTSTQLKKKRRVCGVRRTLYKLFEQPLYCIDLPNLLSPVFKRMEVKPGYLRIWQEPGVDVHLCHSKFGVVHKGSVLSYQQPLCESQSSASDAVQDIPPPVFDLPNLHCRLPQLRISKYSTSPWLSQSLVYEHQTREQSSDKDWHRLRKHRITASKFKDVCSRQKDFERLAARLLKGKTIQTAAMKYGIQHEVEAAEYYSQQFCKTVRKIGFVINPSTCHLGCSPDRWVYDPAEEHPWGLLEIKCTTAGCITKLQYLKYNERNGQYSLRKSQRNYYQVMGCMGVTGVQWSDFFVYCCREFHRENLPWFWPFLCHVGPAELFLFQFLSSSIIRGFKLILGCNNPVIS